MREFLRGFLTLFGVALYRLGLARFVIWLNRRAPRVLLYHACESVESDFIRGLNSNTTPSAFAEHVDTLQKYYRVISLAQLAAGPIPERAVVITFDDGYRSVYDAAFPLLRARGLPATVYLVTGVVDNVALVWVNALNWLLHRHADTSVSILQRVLQAPSLGSPRRYVLHAQTCYDRASVDLALAEICRATGLELRELAADAEVYLTTSQIHELTRHGWSFGSHTVRHPNLSRLSEDECREELEEALRFIGEIDGVPSLSYPFGEFGSGTREIAVSLGYTTVMQVGGVNRALTLSAIGRVPVTATSGAGLFAEMEVVTPLMAWGKRLMSGIHTS